MKETRETCPEPTCRLPRHGKRNKLCFVCFLCGSHQGYDDDGTHGGITEKEARAVGYSKVSGYEWRWLCPTCAGNEDKLDAIFSGE